MDASTNASLIIGPQRLLIMPDTSDTTIDILRKSAYQMNTIPTTANSEQQIVRYLQDVPDTVSTTSGLSARPLPSEPSLPEVDNIDPCESASQNGAKSTDNAGESPSDDSEDENGQYTNTSSRVYIRNMVKSRGNQVNGSIAPDPLPPNTSEYALYKENIAEGEGNQINGSVGASALQAMLDQGVFFHSRGPNSASSTPSRGWRFWRRQ